MPHVYDKKNSAVVTFESKDGGTPRAFTVAYAHAYNAFGLIGTEKNGLFVIEHGREDDPDQYVLFDELHRGDKTAALRTLEAVKNASWPEFANFVRNARARLGWTDHEEIIDPQFRAEKVERAEYPEPGNLRKLISLGVVDLPKEEDLRTQEMIALDADPDNGLSFPERGYEGMVQDIMNHLMYRDDGSVYLAWSVDVPDFDPSGKGGDYGVEADLDDEWAAEFKQNQNNIQDRILENITSLYTEGYYSTAPGNDSGHYEFSFTGGDGGVMKLTEMDGVDLEFCSPSEIGEKLDEMPREDVVKLWKLLICVDRDLGEANLKRTCEQGANSERTRWEEDYAPKLPSPH